MRIRDWKEIVEDVIERDVDPDDWKAVAGNRQRGLGEDMYLAHPRGGVYQLKTYAKNPFEVKGVGARVARRIDDDIDPYLPGNEPTGGRFAVRSAPRDEDDAREKARRMEETIKTHADAPTTPADMFDDVMEALESPAFGPLSYDRYDRPDELDGLSSTFEERDEELAEELDRIIDEDEVGRGFQ